MKYYAVEAEKEKQSKYKAQPCDYTMPDGTIKHFDSKKERDRFAELRMLERAGEISGLRCQVPYELIPKQIRSDGTWEKPVKYIADFVYNDGKKVVVEDVKGYADTRSAAYRLFAVKRKLMLYLHGIEVREV